MEACTSAGVAKYGTPVGLEQQDLKVDMIVVGSSAVSRNGARLGKGEVSCRVTSYALCIGTVMKLIAVHNAVVCCHSGSWGGLLAAFLATCMSQAT